VLAAAAPGARACSPPGPRAAARRLPSLGFRSPSPRAGAAFDNCRENRKTGHDAGKGAREGGRARRRPAGHRGETPGAEPLRRAQRELLFGPSPGEPSGTAPGRGRGSRRKAAGPPARRARERPRNEKRVWPKTREQTLGPGEKNTTVNTAGVTERHRLPCKGELSPGGQRREKGGQENRHCSPLSATDACRGAAVPTEPSVSGRVSGRFTATAPLRRPTLPHCPGSSSGEPSPNGPGAARGVARVPGTKTRQAPRSGLAPRCLSGRGAFPRR